MLDDDGVVDCVVVIGQFSTVGPVSDLCLVTQHISQLEFGSFSGGQFLLFFFCL